MGVEVQTGVRPKAGQRRERKEIDGVLYLRCWGVFHDGDWLRSDRFHKNNKYFTTLCKECHRYKYVHDHGFSRSQRLDEVRKWIWEIVNRCGGFNTAARTLGISSPTLYRWLGRYKGYDNKWIRRESVVKILTTLAGLRDGSIAPVPPPKTPNKKSFKKFRYGCAGCGCELELITPGCETCRDREQKRNQIKRTDPEIQRKKWRDAKRSKRGKLQTVK